jgi:hypothetical protein
MLSLVPPTHSVILHMHSTPVRICHSHGYQTLHKILSLIDSKALFMNINPCLPMHLIQQTPLLVKSLCLYNMMLLMPPLPINKPKNSMKVLSQLNHLRVFSLVSNVSHHRLFLIHCTLETLPYLPTQPFSSVILAYCKYPLMDFKAQMLI